MRADEYIVNKLEELEKENAQLKEKLLEKKKEENEEEESDVPQPLYISTVSRTAIRYEVAEAYRFEDSEEFKHLKTEKVNKLCETEEGLKKLGRMVYNRYGDLMPLIKPTVKVFPHTVKVAGRLWGFEDLILDRWNHYGTAWPLFGSTEDPEALTDSWYLYEFQEEAYKKALQELKKEMEKALRRRKEKEEQE